MLDYSQKCMCGTKCERASTRVRRAGNSAFNSLCGATFFALHFLIPHTLPIRRIHLLGTSDLALGSEHPNRCSVARAIYQLRMRFFAEYPVTTHWCYRFQKYLACAPFHFCFITGMYYTQIFASLNNADSATKIVCLTAWCFTTRRLQHSYLHVSSQRSLSTSSHMSIFPTGSCSVTSCHEELPECISHTIGQAQYFDLCLIGNGRQHLFNANEKYTDWKFPQLQRVSDLKAAQILKN